MGSPVTNWCFNTSSRDMRSAGSRSSNARTRWRAARLRIWAVCAVACASDQAASSRRPSGSSVSLLRALNSGLPVHRWNSTAPRAHKSIAGEATTGVYDVAGDASASTALRGAPTGKRGCDSSGTLMQAAPGPSACTISGGQNADEDLAPAGRPKSVAASRSMARNRPSMRMMFS
jgi:hypothetical protein